MISFALDLVWGYLISERKKGFGITLLLSVFGGMATEIVFALLSLIFGGRQEDITTRFVSGIIHGIVVLACAYLWKRRSSRGYET
jgi:riboflavin transporter FmnP